MQFRKYIELKKKEKEFDCTSCQGELRHCLLHKQKMDLYFRGSIIYNVTRQSYQAVVDAARKRFSEATDLRYLLEYGLCPVPLFSALSYACLQYYNLLGGLGNADFTDLQKYPALYIDAVKVISAAEDEAIKEYGDK